MKSYPIIFSGPMVRALLDGRKVQTRRLAWKDGAQGCDHEYCPEHKPSPWQRRYERWLEGERPWLYVRETWGVWQRGDATPGGKPYDPYILHAATDSKPDDIPEWAIVEPFRWCPSIHMKKRDSRLSLQVTDMRRERLQDISEEDAKAEGIINGVEHPNIRDPGNWWSAGPGSTAFSVSPRPAFEDLWTSIHGPGSWQANPEIVCVSFEVHRQNIERITA